MNQFKSENGGVLVLTLLVIMILSILGLAMLPLSVMEYKISQHFLDFEKAYYIAESGIEEAIAELNHHWDYSGNTNQNIHNAMYDIYIEGTENQRTITAFGKVGTIQRTIKANIERASCIFDISKMKDFAIFSQGDLKIYDLSAIHGGTIASHGNLQIECADQENINSELLIKGEILSTYKDGLGKIKNHNEDLPSGISNNGDLMDLSSFNIDAYIDWLKSNYIVTEFNNTLSHHIKLDLVDADYPNELSSILIIQNFSEVFLSGTFNGLIIINNSDVLKFDNNSIINGMIIFTGNNIETNKLSLIENNIIINGSLICTSDLKQKSSLKLQLYHDPCILAHLDVYLPNDFTIPNESYPAIRILNMKEID